MTRRFLTCFSAIPAVILLMVSAASASAQPLASSQDSLFIYTLTVDQEEYGLIDMVRAVYKVENRTDDHQELPLCCCGVVFFAVRDTSCALYEEGCQIAGCDACPTCFPLLNCQAEGCIPIPMTPGEVREFKWTWDKQKLCEGDPGPDPIFGNIGTFRVYGGYQVCEDGHMDGLLDIPINVLPQVPVLPASWGGIKLKHGETGHGPPPGSSPPSDHP